MSKKFDREAYNKQLARQLRRDDLTWSIVGAVLGALVSGAIILLYQWLKMRLGD